MACASDLRLGRWLEMSGIVAGPLLNRLALFGQPGHLGKRLGRELSEDEESCARAEWVRAELAAAAGGGTGPAR
jgi:protein-arginine kinase